MNLKLLYLIIIFSATIASCSKTNEDVSSSEKRMVIKQDQTTKEFTFTVGNLIELEYCLDDNVSKKNASLSLRSFSSNHLLVDSFTVSCVNITIEKEYTKNAGDYYIDLIQEDHSSVIYILHLKPRKPFGTLNAVVGPKSIKNGPNYKSELTIFPVDTFNNPVGEGMNLEFTTTSSNATSSKYIQHNYGVVNIHSSNQNKVILGAKVGASNSSEKNVRILSGCPVSVDLSISELFPVADGRQFFKVETNKLLDSNKNMIENGTSVSFILYDSLHHIRAKYQALSLNGIASCYIKNPVHKGRYFIKVSVCDTENEKFVGVFEPIINDIKYTWKKDDKIKIGPLTSNLGQLIPDGIPVQVIFKTYSGNQILSASTNNGEVTIDPKDLWNGPIRNEATLTIYGNSFTLTSTEA